LPLKVIANAYSRQIKYSHYKNLEGACNGGDITGIPVHQNNITLC